MRSKFTSILQKPDADSPTLALPTVLETGAIALIAVLLTAIDLPFSSRMGLLSVPPVQDGLTYMIFGKSFFYRLHSFDWSWLKGDLAQSPLADIVAGGYNAIPLWYWLMLVSFVLFGEGEWQCYTIRFWPIFLLLLLVWWIVRRRSNRAIAAISVFLTALLPIVSVGLRYSGKDWLTGDYTRLGWSLTDLRPDMLFGVLLLWTIALLVEQATALNRSALLLAGTFAALTLLAKGSTFPILLLALGLALGYVLLVNRKRPFATFKTALWGLLPFSIIIAPYAAAGGFQLIWNYIISTGVGADRSLYVNPNQSILSDIHYYWLNLPFHLGLEGVLLLILGLGLFVLRAIASKLLDGRSLVYLLLGLTLISLLSLTPGKNYFVGIVAYLPLWIFAWTVLAPVAANLLTRPQQQTSVAFVLVGYSLIVLLTGLFAFQNWPSQFRAAGITSRATMQQVGQDLKPLLPEPTDCFVQADYYLVSFSALYYLIDQNIIWRGALVGSVDLPSAEAFVREKVPQCKAVLVFEQDVGEIRKLLSLQLLRFYPEATEDFFRATKRYVQSPESGFSLFKTYPTLLNSSMELRDPLPRSLTLKLYVRDSRPSPP
jgi:hypothetical protein